MGKQIRINFSSSEDALEAQKYLNSNGFEDVSLNGDVIIIEAKEDNWISAYEMGSSLGGSFDQDTALLDEIHNQYGIDGESVEEVETELVDPEAYIDVNLGYGDYEIIEPYVLHKFVKLTDETEGNREEK